ncbi:CobW family GTP-binding protein [Fodinibius salsisoli]|uniref:GTP-binding protein n=1 Tax=Fodinibius salsisoli TaxID=2820877 RepID=A0ABT3PK13_9BACT|nr:GTP-binding protein [Fodinibius salsisoli]MCW9706282.1 GTP-binding protein [Fodinibius salsisoli]
MWIPGSRKTTLLNHILENSQGKRIAIIVNEFGKVNVDSKLVKHTTEEMIELSNGCICCTLRGDLIEGVDDVITKHDIDHIIIESTGIGEPVPIAQAFYVEPELLELNPEIPNIQHSVFVDAVITVVDSSQFMDMYQRETRIPDDQFNRGFGQLLAEQVEGADILLLNKTDKSSEGKLIQLEELLSTMNPRAQMIRSSHGEVPVRQLIDIGVFDIQTAEQSALWVEELEKEHTPESEEYGIQTYVYKTKHRFIERKLIDILENGLPSNIYRSKGLVALQDSDTAFLWNHAGKFLEFNAIGRFSEPAKAYNEIVFIGNELDTAQIEETLEEALAA